MKILVIRFSSLGDVVLTTPILNALRQKFPQAEIYFLVKESYSEIIHPEIHVVPIAKKISLRKIYCKLKPLFPFTAVLDLQSNLRSRILSFFIPKQKVAHFKKPYLKRFLTILTKKNFLKNVPSVPERYAEALKKLFPKENFRIHYRPWIKSQNLNQVELKKLLKKNYFVVAPGAKHFTKKWPLIHFQNLLFLLEKKYKNYQIVFISSAEEKSDCLFISQNLKNKPLIFSGILSLTEIVTLISKSKFVICNDSGLMHIASATDVPIYALFTSTIPEFGFKPLSPFAKILTAKNIPCRPCNHKGLKKCPLRHYRCGWELTPQQVFHEIHP